MARRAQIIPPRQDLKRKAVNATRGLDLTLTPAVVRRLEEVVHKSRDKFTVDIGRRMRILREIVSRMREEPDYYDEGARMIWQESLQIKGAGGTIGFQLLTTFAKLLGDFVRDKNEFTAKQIAVIDLHIDALYVVLADRIEGNGGILEEQVVIALQEAVEHFS